jgi:hypothetical protein
MNMDTGNFSETFVPCYQTTRHRLQKGRTRYVDGVFHSVSLLLGIFQVEEMKFLSVEMYIILEN